MLTQIKLALRVLARRKVFTAISLVGITLTLVVLVVISAILDSFLTAAKPQSRLDRMLFVFVVSQRGPSHSNTGEPGFGFAEQTVRGLPGAERVSLFSALGQAAIYTNGSRLTADWRRTDGEYWRIHDFEFVSGTSFTADDDRVMRPVAVISESLAGTIFGNAKAATGKTLNLNGRTHTITGVVRDVPVARSTALSQVWTPLGPPAPEQRAAVIGELNLVVLARSTGDIDAIRSEFRRRVAAYPVEDPKNFPHLVASLDTNYHALARRLTDGAFGDRGAAILTSGAVFVAFLFMVLPALNLITLNLSRTLERSSEIGVRRAFGASRRSLVRQFVFENVVLTVIGGLVSVLLAIVLLQVIESSGVFPAAEFSVNFRVLAYGIGFAVVFGVLSGAWPAWRMSRLHPVDALRGGAL